MKPSQDSFLKTDSIDEQLDIIIEKYKVHPSIQKIKDNNPFLSHFSLSCATEDTILQILLSLNVTKGAGYDTLPPKVIRFVSPIIASPYSNNQPVYHQRYISRSAQNSLCCSYI